MLGVEAKGTERLYEYGPDELTWEVVEFKEGNLDSDEKYWIDYFKCREIGLNKKRQVERSTFLFGVEKLRTWSFVHEGRRERKKVPKKVIYPPV